MQYEQLIETLENVFKVPTDLIRPPAEVPATSISVIADSMQPGYVEHDLSSFEINQKFKRRLFLNQDDGGVDASGHAIHHTSQIRQMEPKVSFELPTFIIQLKNEVNHPLIEITFRDFKVNYECKNSFETSVQVSLRSLLMEDLLQLPDSKHRAMVVSSSPDEDDSRSSMRSDFSSRSCPNLNNVHLQGDCISGSLPENLESGDGFHISKAINRTACPDTPPPSPQPKRGQDNLVLYSALLIDPECPTFESQYKSMRQQSNIDFNSLDLVVSVQSWFVLLNFFGLLSDETDGNRLTHEISTIDVDDSEQKKGNSELDISVRSLTLVFNRPDHEIAKANVSNAHFIVSKYCQANTVEGKLGSISLIDLTSHGGLYRERFLTTGNEALNFVYYQDGPKINKRSLLPDARLKIQMSTVRYVHTKRFVSEIQTFFAEFQQLQTVELI